MLKLFAVKWLLVAFVAGPGGGALTKIASFDTEAQCRKGQDEVEAFRRRVDDELQQIDAPVVHARLFADCLKIPVDEAHVYSPQPTWNLGGGGK